MPDSTQHDDASSSPNPYLPMLGSYSADNFVGRREVVSSLVQAVTGRIMGSRLVRGIRTIGKTTLLHYLADPNGALEHYKDDIGPDFSDVGRNNLLWVYVPFEGEQVQRVQRFKPSLPVTLGKLLRTLHTEIQRYAEEHPDSSVGSLIPSTDRDSDLTADLDLAGCYGELQKLLTQLARRGVRVVFLLDDLDEVLADVTKLEEGFARTLQTRAIFVVGMRKLASNIDSSFLNPTVVYDLGLLNPADATELLLRPLKNTNKSLRKTDITFLLDVAGRQPYLLTAAAAIYLPFRDIMQLDSATELHPATVEQSFIQALRRQPNVRRALDTLWDEVTSEPDSGPARRLLHQYAIAEAQGEPVLRQDAVYFNLLLELEERGLIAIEDGRPKVFSRLFAQYVRERYPKWGQQVHPTREQFTAAIQTLLGPKDNKLFSYLAAQPGKLCTHGELLAEVWGITDLAQRRPLDASVNRLRRVLEGLDPGWQYIENEHGEGFRFRPRQGVPGGQLPTI